MSILSILDYPIQTSNIIILSTIKQDNNYIPLQLKNLTTDKKVPFDIYLKVIFKGKDIAEYVMCCPKDEIFYKKWNSQLINLKIDFVYFQNKDAEMVTQYLTETLDSYLESSQYNDMEKTIFTYDYMQTWNKHFFTIDEMRKSEQVDRSLKYIDKLSNLIRQEHINLGFVLDIRKHDENIYTHSLNVSLIALSFLAYLGWSTEKARSFGIGALLHDIGYIDIPKSQIIIKKEEALTDDEMEIVEKHPTIGYKMLKNYVCIWRDPLLMVLQHHENGDGSGYPQKLSFPVIHPWATILRIIDSFEAITAHRSWRPAWPPDEAMRIMRTDWEMSNKYDPRYLKAFANFLAKSKMGR